MNEWRHKDTLLQTSRKTYSVVPERVVVNDNYEQLSGWKITVPKPLYKIYPKRNRQTVSKKNNPLLHNKLYPVISMGGRLDEEYDYVYDGGLSTRVPSCTALVESSQSTIKLKPCPSQCVPLTHLNPLVLDKSVAISDTVRHDLRRLVQMQMKPDIMYERILIEQRLRTMEMAGGQGALAFDLQQTPSHKSVHVQSINQQTNWHSPAKKKRAKNVYTKRKLLRNYTDPPAFKRTSNQHNDPMVRTSFSRLLESSSITFFNKK